MVCYRHARYDAGCVSAECSVTRPRRKVIVMHIPDIDLSHLSPEQVAEVRRIAEDPQTRALLYLVGNKIPWDLANALTFEEKISFARAVARIENSDFNWDTMRPT
jgi:hypothetical protein